MSEFLKRTLSGAVFVAVMLTCILVNPWTLMLLLLAIAVIALYEFYKISGLRGYTPLIAGGIASGVFVIILVFLERQSFIPRKYLELLMLPAAGLWLSFILVRRSDFTASITMTLTGLLYVILPLSLIPFLTQSTLTGLQYNPEILIGILCIIWTNDTGAYLSGISLGKHKMAPSISPKKSWEGFFGGMILAVAAGIVYSGFFKVLSRFDWIMLSIIIVLAGTAGDLFESVLKREAGIKDSGKIMPGHGGILDRFDSLLMIVPFVFLYIYLVKL